MQPIASLNQIDHIMTSHDMSSNVNMLNQNTFHDIQHFSGNQPHRPKRRGT